MNLPLSVNDTVGPSVPMKCGANGKTAKANVYGPIFANFSLNWARVSFITTSRPSIDMAYLVQGHTLKSAPDGSIIFFFPGYANKILLPNPGLRLYKSRGYTFELQPIEVPRRSSVSGRMTRSRSRNAAMDMPSLQPQAFHGYAGYAPAAGTVGPSAG